VAIAFYISGHGFGHASRQVEVINQLGLERPVLIRSAVAPGLLARTLRVPYTLVAGPCDTGIVQSSSVAHDDDATVDAAVAFHATYDRRIAEDVALLRDAGVRLVVGDIPPLAFSVAAALDVPAIAMANFTWDWIYESHPGFADRAAPVLAAMRGAYRQAALALELPFSGGFDVFRRVTRLPLVARRPTRTRQATRAHFGLPARGRVALLSFGGYGLPSLDLAAVDCRADWSVVTTDRTGASAGGAVVVTEDALAGGFRYEDLVAASDVVVTKPGYGIIAECISAGVAMLYTSRGAFREYDLLVREMPRVVRCRFIDHADLFAGRWRDALEAVIEQPSPPDRLDVNGADVAAATLQEALAGRL
jgi:L-arabinokinase